MSTEHTREGENNHDYILILTELNNSSNNNKYFKSIKI